MRIGIDIDDTLTDIKEELEAAALHYAKELGKETKEVDDTEDKEKNRNSWQQRYHFTYEELKYFLKDIQEGITQKAKPREGVVETIKKLRKEGNEIYIVTARCSEFHEDPYQLSKDWLEKNEIEYDKLIVNAREKASVCKQEKIELFIDDQLENCRKVAREGIKVIRVTKEKEQYGTIMNKTDWKEISDTIYSMIHHKDMN